VPERLVTAHHSTAGSHTNCTPGNNIDALERTGKGNKYEPKTITFPEFSLR
jgi:hypothetical protein